MSSRLHKVKNRPKSVTLKELLRDEKKKIRLFFLLSGVLLIVLGLLLSKPLVSKPSSILNVDGTVTSFSQEPVKVDKSLTQGKKEQKIKNPPIRILISDLKIDLTIKESKVINGYWEVFSDTAAFGLGSAYPEDEGGNQVIFAHARRGLFLPLREAKIGQIVLIFTKDKWFQYKIKEIKEVVPNQIEVIAPTKEPILTLYTCSGFADSKRLIVIAEKFNL